MGETRVATSSSSRAACRPGGYILERLAELSRPFGTRIEIKGDTAEITVKR